MTFLAPLFLAAGAAVAGGIVLLHFLARRRPRAAILPTARFVPDRPARWPSPAPRPTDWLLLVIRVLAIGAVAAAFAGPVREPDRAITSRIVLVDQSRAGADERSVRDSVLSVVRDGDIVITFDTAVRVIASHVRDTAATLTRSRAPASLSAALVAAERAAAMLRDGADSIELTIVSPFATEAWDEATELLRTRWHGRARLITLPLALGDTAERTIDVRAPRSDPVRAAAAPLLNEGEGRTRIVRGVPSPQDSAWAAEQDRVLVHWASARDGDSVTAEGVAAHDVVMVAPLVRRTLDVNSGRIMARFADGAPAIIERELGAGCLREVAFDLPGSGDVALRESARRLLAMLAAPCEGRGPRRMLSATQLNSLRGAGPLLATAAVPRSGRARSEATPWLLMAGALLLLLELGVRQRQASV
ncbi:MAG TPA: BatA domain-containing protein [Gemmatimonadaceae bacterium]|nr:BatA domain-containing protein [Gemmatimonadaceae bacterium]